MDDVVGVADRTDPAICELGGLRIRIPPAGYGETITKSIKSGGYEHQERNTLSAILKPGDRVLEVGGAIGAVSMTCAKIIGAENIVTFEANPKLVENARTNFALNNLAIAARTGVLQNRICWAGRDTTAPFYVHQDFWASSLADKPGTAEIIQVPTYCFEDEARDFRANVLICDIEGGEIELLTLADLSGFDRIMMEIHYWAGREGVNKLMRKLVFDGFTVNFDLSAYSVVCLHRGLLP
jgi:FkbM family methyltransferase